ncbi:AAA family ATPase [Leptolyngbya sp. CCNP1308]|uniref:nSTAND1 domain-containing NTPase n=1 Tax=Leptolyngbya sp. CCNP1308 TaxID=3110255 RepID=UPI002B200913|nr:AAA family ATPase [Leptolyngbya sp. CCNP1308]MEA5449321.1 AAA family ATPase [Leptolyngbya sp. CCNP1308]
MTVEQDDSQRLVRDHRSIHIEENAVGSAIVSGDGNIINVIHQTTQQRQEPAAADAPVKLGLNPYKGLAAFTEQDGDRYFGREAQVERLWERFQRLVEQSAVPRLLPILGPSGCGKSSLARAGLIPALAQRPVLGKAQLRVAVLMPGSHPLEALAGVLAKAATQDPLPVTKTREFATELGLVNKEGVYDGLRRIASLIPQIHDAPLVVLVDQFEEVYSLCKDLDERQAFIDNLLAAAQDPSSHVSVLITLRSDFLGETQRHPTLSQVIGSDQSVIVPPMTAAELREAIARPAEQADHLLDAATIDLLVQDTEGREGALPLLQFALTRIWEGLAEGKAPAETYRQMGGVGGALAGKAQKIYDQLLPKEQETARRIFLGLVQLGEGTRDTRRRAPVASLIASQDSPEAVKQVLARFSSSGARLVTLASQGHEEVAEVTHEALFGHWQSLNDWLDSSRDDIRFQRRLEAAADHWHDQRRPAGLLWQPPDLNLLRTFVKTSETHLNQRCLDFFHASDWAERRRRRLKRLGVTGLAVGLVLTTGLSTFAGYQVRRAELRQIQIYTAEARDLAEIDPLSSMVNGLAAISLGHNPLVKLPHVWEGSLVSAAVLDLGNRHARFDRVVGDHQYYRVNSVGFSPDGQTLVSGSSDGTVRLWDRSGQLIGEPFVGHQTRVTSVGFSPDGQTLVSGGSDGTVRLWNRSGQSISEPFVGHQEWVSSVGFSPDGQTLVSGGWDGTVRLWDRSGQPIGEPFVGHQDGVSSVGFSPDGQTLVSGGSDGTVRLWNRSGQPIGKPFMGHQDGVSSVGFSPDGQNLVSGGDDGTVRLWDPSGQPIGEPFMGHQNWVWSVGFSLDGQTLVSGGSDGTVRLWNRSGQPIGEPFVGHQDGVRSLEFSPDGQTLVSGGRDGTVRLWDRSGQPIGEPFVGHQDGVSSVGFSPDGQTLVSGGNDGMVRLWDRSGQPIGEPFVGHQDGVNSVRFSPDGQTLVSGGRDGTARLWDRSGQPIGEPFVGHQDGVSLVGFSPDRQTIIRGGNDGTALRLQDEVNSVGFSPDGQTLVSGGLDGTVRLWNRSGQPVRKPFVGHQNWVGSVGFSPNGQTLVSGGWDGTVRLWDPSGQPIGESFVGHQASVRSVEFSPDGQTLVSGGDDGTVRLWPVWLAEQGWVSYTCDRIRPYLLARSSADETVRLARRTCERFAWR